MGVFGFKKNKKENEKENENVFEPSFGTAEDFMRLYAQGNEHIVIGRTGDSDVSISANSKQCNKIIIVNNDQDSIENQCVNPIVLQGNLSYVVYDPDGKYHDVVCDKMKDMGYDVQLVDMTDEQNKSRIDLFEAANITRNTYWTSLMLSSSIKCDISEIKVVHNVLMALMQYLLTVNKKIKIEDMYRLFEKIVENNDSVMDELRACSSSRNYILRFENSDVEIRNSALRKIDEHFFNTAIVKAKNPNIFTVTAHKKKTAIFIKEVPLKYQYLITALLFNLKTTNVLCGDGELNTLIIDTCEEKWYNRVLLEKLSSEVGSIMENGTAIMRIRSTVVPSETKNTIMVYINSNDDQTQEYVFDFLRIENQLTKDEKDEISKQFFKGRELPYEVLCSAPITIDEFKDIEDCIVIDTSKAAKPFRCEQLR